MTHYIYAEESGHEENLQATTLEDARDEARQLLRDGDWSIGLAEHQRTIYPDAKILVEDADGEREIVDRVSVAIEPEPPKCEHDDGHDWQSPLEVVGGIEENPGCWGHGGGVIIREVCARCGRYRVTDTWDQSQGPDPVETVHYEDADDTSEAWVRRIQAPKDLLDLVEAHGAETVNAAIRAHYDDSEAYIDTNDGEIYAAGAWQRGDALVGMPTAIEGLL